MFRREIDAILSHVDAARQNGGRVLVAIAGAPGSGKSTLASELVAAIRARGGDGAASLVPMDGFHFDNADLDAMGVRAVKGAPQTFDASGFVSLVRRIKCNDGPVSFPLFDRALDRTIPDAGKLAAGTQAVVFEGNYLLLRDGAWAELAGIFDVTVMLSVPMGELRARLIARWLTYGLPQAAAEKRADGNDMTNARLVIAQSAPADLTLGSDFGANA